MGLGRVPRSPSFFCLVIHATFRQLRDGQFSPNLATKRRLSRYPVDESEKSFSKIFSLGVICPQNFKSKISQTGTSLRVGYRSRDALQRYILFTAGCSQRARQFRTSVTFSVRRTVAELRGLKVAQFSDFGLFSPYKTPKTYLPMTSLLPRSYIAE